MGAVRGGVTQRCVCVPPQVKTHLQAQTLSAMAVGHQHNHEVRRGTRFGGTAAAMGPSGSDAALAAGYLKPPFGPIKTL